MSDKRERIEERVEATAPTPTAEWTIDDWKSWYLTAIEVGQEKVNELHRVEAERDRLREALERIATGCGNQMFVARKALSESSQ